jgi:hypothetical protein
MNKFNEYLLKRNFNENVADPLQTRLDAIIKFIDQERDHPNNAQNHALYDALNWIENTATGRRDSFLGNMPTPGGRKAGAIPPI